jgi:hypothetical protein
MDLAMENLGQLTILLESKSIERLWFCQIQNNGDMLINNLRKALRLDDSGECVGESGQGYK